MARKGEPKKPVMVRLRIDSYKFLLEHSGKQSVQRGMPVSVPLLIAEEMDKWIARLKNKEAENGKLEKGVGA